MAYSQRDSMGSRLGQGTVEIANCVSVRHFHTTAGMGSGPGLRPMAYQAIFVLFLAPLYPVFGSSPSPAVGVKTSA